VGKVYIDLNLFTVAKSRLFSLLEYTSKESRLARRRKKCNKATSVHLIHTAVIFHALVSKTFEAVCKKRLRKMGGKNGHHTRKYSQGKFQKH
jgi:hypothetical protein